MVEVRTLKDFSSAVVGSKTEGDVFSVEEHYADHFEEHGLVERLDAKPALEDPAGEAEATPKTENTPPQGEKVSEAPPITGAPRRLGGRPRKDAAGK